MSSRYSSFHGFVLDRNTNLLNFRIEFLQEIFNKRFRTYKASFEPRFLIRSFFYIEFLKFSSTPEVFPYDEKFFFVDTIICSFKREAGGEVRICKCFGLFNQVTLQLRTLQ